MTMNINPFFSIIVPVYNKGPHIKRCLYSIINQSFSNFEIIIVNDASTDNSLEEINKIDDSRIFIFSRKIPGAGGYAARNYGISKSKGNFITFLDADDVWSDNHLLTIFNLINLYKDISIFSSGWKIKNGNKISHNSFYKKYYKFGIKSLNLDDYLFNASKYDLPIWTSVVFFKNVPSLFNDLFPINEEIKRGGDLYAWLKLISYFKTMIWSNHLGATYHIDSVNMVTRKAKISLKLFDKEYFNKICELIDEPHSIFLLKKYFNSRILISILVNNRYGVSRSDVRNCFYWDGSFTSGLISYIFSFLPKSFLKVYKLLS